MSKLLKWSTRLPKKEGWYWFTSKWDKPPTIVLIWKPPNVSYYLFGDGRLPANLEDWPGKWAGPIEEPKDAKS
jgi:hypothetical protein